MKIKSVLFSIFLLCPLFTIIGQEDWEDFEKVANVESTEVAQLSKLITGSFESDTDKAKAIYYWVTKNIAYDVKLYNKELLKSKKKKKKKPMTDEKKAKLEAKELSKVLKKKVGVARHYSLLISELCKYADVRCEIIKGKSKMNPKKVTGLGQEHEWNAVFIDDGWHLVDAVLGAGYVVNNEDFIAYFDGNYFAPNKETFVMNHFPKDENWQLTDTTVTRDSYKEFPVIGSGYLRYNLSNLQPIINKLEVEEGTPIEITFDLERDLPLFLCFYVRGNELLPIRYEYEKGKITINTNGLRSGTYLFQVDEKVLFSYSIRLN